MDDSYSRLRAKLKASEAKEAHVRSELADLKGHLRRQTQESEFLREEVTKLKRMLTVRLPVLSPLSSVVAPQGLCLPLKTTTLCGLVSDPQRDLFWGNTVLQSPDMPVHSVVPHWWRASAQLLPSFIALDVCPPLLSSCTVVRKCFESMSACRESGYYPHRLLGRKGSQE